MRNVFGLPTGRTSKQVRDARDAAQAARFAPKLSEPRKDEEFTHWDVSSGPHRIMGTIRQAHPEVHKGVTTTQPIQAWGRIPGGLGNMDYLGVFKTLDAAVAKIASL